MAYTITNNCISCDRCNHACPTGAIRVEGTKRWIDPNLCNNCVGYYSVPQCAAVCPTNRACIPVIDELGSTTNSDEYWEAWSDNHDRLVTRLSTTKPTRYWERWFAAYSLKLSKQLHSEQK